MNLNFAADDAALSDAEFLDLFRVVWPAWAPRFDPRRVQEALHRTLNFTARDAGRLVSCLRVITDGYLNSSVCELMVHRDYQDQGIEAKLLDLAYEHSPSGLMIGVQAVSGEFMTSLGWTKGPVCYFKRKPPTGQR